MPHLGDAPTVEEIFAAGVLEEPLVPIGHDPSSAENVAVSVMLAAYRDRVRAEDLFSLVDFLDAHTGSPWRAAVLVNLGLVYYRTGFYSKAMDAWRRAWEVSKNADADLRGRALADRAVGELACMLARAGRTDELASLLGSVEGRVFRGPATEMLVRARESLSEMRTHPETSFRCGPLALHRIMVSLNLDHAGTDLAFASRSTPKGFSLSQLAQLSQEMGLDFQMAYRRPGAEFVVPGVVHLRLDHYAAIIRYDDGRYLLEDPTFGDNRWVTPEALESEASGYFMIQAGSLKPGWRTVDAPEAQAVWGRGLVAGPDPGAHGPCDPNTESRDRCGRPDPDCKGMARPRIHLLMVSLNIVDDPVGYTPPVGPAVRFKVRYNHRECFHPANFAYSHLGPKWTFDWLSYITDDPHNSPSDVRQYLMGGGTRTFSGFDQRTQSFAFQKYDQSRLMRMSATSYEMISRDGTRKVFGRPDGTAGSGRKVFLTEYTDPSGNSVTLSYDERVRLTNITDSIGRVTILSYENSADRYRITKVTDPFGRFATFDYDVSGRLARVVDVMGMASDFAYAVNDNNDFIETLTTPYGVTSFTKWEASSPKDDTTRWLDISYPDGERERVEFNQYIPPPPPALSDPDPEVPRGMRTWNFDLERRNTFYWDKQACAFGYGDYSKARLYHWLHLEDKNLASGILESTKEPLEGRVWYNYPGQSDLVTGPASVGTSNRPTRVGRVLDDGSTQLRTSEYNAFGNVTKAIDPVGRTMSYFYADNGIDLLETRQTRDGQDELLARISYNAQHQPVTSTGAAGQTTSYTYNTRGQLLSSTNAKNEVTNRAYDPNGYLTMIEGPLSGDAARVTFTYDSAGRARTRTHENQYVLTFDYDTMDRLTKITYPDGSFEEYAYTRLDRTAKRDRTGRWTSYEFNNVQQLVKQTDPLNRMSHYQWCRCGALRQLTDPRGRTTTWRHDIQGRLRAKEHPGGKKITFAYENTTSRLKLRVDENLQVTQYTYDRDDLLIGRAYTNTTVPTPAVSFTYDDSYPRLTSMSDGVGTTRYHYGSSGPAAGPGAGKLAAVEGPLPHQTLTFRYDELGRRISTAVNEVESSSVLDAGGRVTSATNALGTTTYGYDGASYRQTSQKRPNGLVTESAYGDALNDFRLQRFSNRFADGTPLSEHTYHYDIHAGRIASRSRQYRSQPPTVYTFTYDAVDQLTSAVLSRSGAPNNEFRYHYDTAGNRTSASARGKTTHYFYNALNELTSSDASHETSVFLQYDAEHRIVARISGDDRVEYTYDGLGRYVAIRRTTGGVETSHRTFVWDDDEIREERGPDGSVVKRFFSQGVQLLNGPHPRVVHYTRDHLGSIREAVDDAGHLLARYEYDPFGHPVRLAGDMDVDFLYAGMFYSAEAALYLARFRAYDPVLGRWLTRDPFRSAFPELGDGPNLYSYVKNNPENLIDPLGLTCCGSELKNFSGALLVAVGACVVAVGSMIAKKTSMPIIVGCLGALLQASAAGDALDACKANCPPDPTPPPPPLSEPWDQCEDSDPPLVCDPDRMCPEPDEPIFSHL